MAHAKAGPRTSSQTRATIRNWPDGGSACENRRRQDVPTVFAFGRIKKSSIKVNRVRNKVGELVIGESGFVYCHRVDRNADWRRGFVAKPPCSNLIFCTSQFGQMQPLAARLSHLHSSTLRWQQYTALAAVHQDVERTLFFEHTIGTTSQRDV